MKVLPFLTMLLLLLGVNSCTSDQIDLSRDAEMAYVDLLCALHQDQAAEARLAADDLDFLLREMRGGWPRPLKMEQLDNQLYHLGKAEWAYDDARESIEAGNLELARVQLDRATYEFSAAVPGAFQELYIGGMYEFFVAWLEVEQVAGDSELCSLNWQQFSQYALDARVLWRQNKYHRPESRAYTLHPVDEAAFAAAHQRVNEELNNFIEMLEKGDQCRSQLMADGVSEAVWELIRLFGRGRVEGI